MAAFHAGPFGHASSVNSAPRAGQTTAAVSLICNAAAKRAPDAASSDQRLVRSQTRTGHNAHSATAMAGTSSINATASTGTSGATTSDSAAISAAKRPYHLLTTTNQP